MLCGDHGTPYKGTQFVDDIKVNMINLSPTILEQGVDRSTGRDKYNKPGKGSYTRKMASPPHFTELNDLAVEKNGGKILFATDDWFAVAENLIKSAPAEWKPEAFTEFGKWMDGWETRRKRKPGHDWCIIQLGVPGTIHGFNVDTSYFTGNFVPKISIQAASLDKMLPARTSAMGTKCSPEDLENIASFKSEDWTELVPMSKLEPGFKGSCNNYFRVDNQHIQNQTRWTHLRINSFPDGGIARLRVYGQANPDWSKISQEKEMDLCAMLNGGICIGYSNAFYGHPRQMIGPGQAASMADGWETARRLDRPSILEADNRGILQVPGCEWAVFRLGHPGTIEKIEVDTTHFRGNYPDSCKIEGCLSSEADEEKLVSQYDNASVAWQALMPVQKLSAHKRHIYSGDELYDAMPVSHVRITIAPDGGLSRLRLWGHKATRYNLAKL
ncbi:unnamed protein product [Owenia fusiformis]|uniref:Allantoate amidinohydrolase n=1 Tax=Owenia fusiformis TaxID=6347 RepID=A0A8J1T5X2_OWEFU|nr:unnamed protein product [Owenia fusiformis]